MKDKKMKKKIKKIRRFVGPVAGIGDGTCVVRITLFANGVEGAKRALKQMSIKRKKKRKKKKKKKPPERSFLESKRAFAFARTLTQ